MEEVPLNNSPDLSMEQITKLLFNNEFMSDIQFHIEGYPMYAHSFELMKRSVVFRQQFRTNMGENKLIPIQDVTYSAFFQFMRFIYTDECMIEERMVLDLLKLAVRYKIVTLETKVLSKSCTSNDINFHLYQFGILNKYELCINAALSRIFFCTTTEDTMKSTFLNIDQNVLEEFLKCNTGLDKFEEFDLFEALVRWINNSCEKHGIPLEYRRSHFDKLIRLIRFPVMSHDKFDMCLKICPDLFTDEDIGTITRHRLPYKTITNTSWNCQKRLAPQKPWGYPKYSLTSKWLTKFSVSDHLILRGVRFGIIYGPNTQDYQLQISSIHRITKVVDTLRFKFTTSDVMVDTISLGDSIMLLPDFQYTIETIFTPTIRNKGDEDKLYICCRKPNISAAVTGPDDKVTITEVSKNLIEICFKSVSK